MKLIRHWSEEVVLSPEMDIRVGDQLVIPLSGFGEFTATAQLYIDEGATFLFDDCITERKMNENDTNRGGFEASDLCAWMRDILLPSFPEELRPRIKKLTIPTYGQIFGHDSWYKLFMEPDDDKQFPVMTKRKNRITNNDYNRYWLKNATNENVSAIYFAYVNYSGNANYNGASTAAVGVRPVFLLMKQPISQHKGDK